MERSQVLQKEIKYRIIYALATIILLVIEVLIALYVHDSFVRPYIGDVLVVVVIYTFVRVWIPMKYRILPIWIFLFAATVEVLQLFNIIEIFGLQENTFMRILIGSVFDIKDIACYAVGCILMGIYELIVLRKRADF